MNSKEHPNEKSLDEFRTKLRREMPRLREEHSVSFLEIFGSFVRGEASMNSDLDLLVEFEGVPTLFSFVRLGFDGCHTSHSRFVEAAVLENHPRVYDGSK